MTTMPVTLTVTVPDPPIAPTGYLLVAFEVIDVGHERQPERGIYPLTQDGYERAAGQYLARAVTGQQLAAVAWFADAPLTDCPDGQQRLVSHYNAELASWSRWVAEERIGPGSSTHRVTRPKSKDRCGPTVSGHKDVGDSVPVEAVDVT